MTKRTSFPTSILLALLLVFGFPFYAYADQTCELEEQPDLISTERENPSEGSTKAGSPNVEEEDVVTDLVDEDTMPEPPETTGDAVIRETLQEESSNIILSGSAHIQNLGTVQVVNEGKPTKITYGNPEQQLNLEAFSLALASDSGEGSIRYKSHVSNIGWMDYVDENTFSGSINHSQAIEAVVLELQGGLSSSYQLYYRAYVKNIGWLNWVANGEKSGSEGCSWPVQAMQVAVVPIEEAAPTNEESKVDYGFIDRSANPVTLSAYSHVSDLGDMQKTISNGFNPVTTGTTGKALQMEGFVLDVQDLVTTGSIMYQVHVANIGWMDSVNATEYAGTKGRGLQLEAMRVSLTGDLATKYDIYYRVHSQHFGWMGWAANGQAAGTAGYAYRAEAVQVALVEKGTTPYSTEGHFRIAPKAINLDISAKIVLAGGQEILISAEKRQDQTYLFLPSMGSFSFAGIYFSATDIGGTLLFGQSLVPVTSGSSLDVSSLGVRVSENRYDISIRTLDGIDLPALAVMKSSNIDSMFITSDDPVNYGREYIESSSDHTLQATGAMRLVKENGSVIYDEKLTQIKGRGNSTWSATKKPYQIKLNKKTDLLETGLSSEVNKTWVLLSNPQDPTFSKNAIAYGIGQELGMDGTTGCKSIDLFYDGQYRGTYLLCEKVEVGTGRVAISDLEKENEKVNESIESLPLVVGKNTYGMEMQYSEGANNPSDITGGYLFEYDQARGKREAAWFTVKTKSNTLIFASKSPEFWSYEEANYLSCLMQDMVDCIENGGTHPASGKVTGQYIDLVSLSQVYWVNEFMKNPDGFDYSSTYFYKDKGVDTLIKSGPIWDFDISCGYRNDLGLGTSYDYYTSGTKLGSVFSSDTSALDAIRDFASTFLEAVAGLFSGGQDPDSDPRLQEYKSVIEDSQAINNTRWHNVDFESTFSTMAAWLFDRYTWLIGAVIPTSEAHIVCSAHVSDFGWIGSKINGTSGTTGRGLRMEAFQAQLNESSTATSGTLRYNAHVSDIGWQNNPNNTESWFVDNAIAGTTGKAKQVEAVQFALAGDIADSYDVYYRAHVQDYGWMNWAKNGQMAGTTGKAKRIEAIQVVLVEKDSAPGSDYYGVASMNTIAFAG